MARDRDTEAQIAEVDLFRGLSKGQVKRLAGAAKEVTHPAGKAVSTEGLGGLAFHYILEGTATVTKDGRELRTLGPGDYFGEISMIDGRPRSATVSAVDTMKVLAIPHQDFEAVIDNDPDFARQLLKTLCARLREAEARSTA
ncbi:Crp/Fnr family transcriptional regulator [Nocardioides astragali]|uniref:Crp/Fnr family transcriptional regulator n=1 Tax=Nocardioides astragali TaxID=1776736 RepID=A0ABW2N2M6_9ACTN|nr:cyclic nucleotide-binding domain-containing protein [Nocardioides astragali]